MEREKRNISAPKKQKTSRKAPTFEQDGPVKTRTKDRNLILDGNIFSNTNFPSVQVPEHIEAAMRKVVRNHSPMMKLTKKMIEK